MRNGTPSSDNSRTRARAAGRIACLAIAVAGGASACAWDWTVRDADPDVDASSDATTGPIPDANATTDADGEATVPPDAETTDAMAVTDSAPEQDAPPVADARSDAPTVDCHDLMNQADAARVAARSCTLGDTSECVASVADRCGCTVFVANGDAGSSRNFASLSRELQMSGCTTDCAGCTAPPTRGSCLETNSVIACYP